jgi:hypothetical protein
MNTIGTVPCATLMPLFDVRTAKDGYCPSPASTRRDSPHSLQLYCSGSQTVFERRDRAFRPPQSSQTKGTIHRIERCSVAEIISRVPEFHCRLYSKYSIEVPHNNTMTRTSTLCTRQTWRRQISSDCILDGGSCETPATTGRAMAMRTQDYSRRCSQWGQIRWRGWIFRLH